jgi:hypothetical protein
MDPWTEELVHSVGEISEVDELWSQTRTETGPVMLFGVQMGSTSKAMYASNFPVEVNVPNYQVRMLSLDQTTALRRWVVAAVTPAHRFSGGFSVPVSATTATRSELVPEGSDLPVTWELRTGLLVDPLNLAAAQHCFMKERLNGLPDPHGAAESDSTEKLLLIDAFTHSPSFGHYSDQIVHSALQAHAEVCSSSDQKHERLLGLRKKFVTMFVGETALRDAEEDNRYRAFQQALVAHMTTERGVGGVQLTSTTVQWTHLCLNAGYFRTFLAFAPHLRPEPLVPSAVDPWRLRDYLFPHVRAPLSGEAPRRDLPHL